MGPRKKVDGSSAGTSTWFSIGIKGVEESSETGGRLETKNSRHVLDNVGVKRTESLEALILASIAGYELMNPAKLMARILRITTVKFGYCLIAD